jgi:CRP-like cAMP-binding protein
VAVEPTAVLRLSHAGYGQLLQQAVARELAEKFLFLQKVEVLRACTLRQLLAIAQRTQRVDASRHQVICRQGEVPGAVYFVVEGAVKVVQRVSLTPPQPTAAAAADVGNADAEAALEGCARARPLRGVDYELMDLGEVDAGWHFGEFGILRQTVRTTRQKWHHDLILT